LGEGETTSGSFSPTLNQSIALARLPLDVAIGSEVEVEIRDKRLKARVVKPCIRPQRQTPDLKEPAMNTPANLKYAASHEWAKLESDGTVTIGITDHAQGALGDIVFLELPDVGRKVKAGEECAVVESVKAASDIYAPVSGESSPPTPPPLTRRNR
jgi:biotin carboxyl carrier protein